MSFEFEDFFFPERCDLWRRVSGGKDPVGGLSATYTKIATNVPCSIDDASVALVPDLDAIAAKIAVVVGTRAKHDLAENDLLVPYVSGVPTATFVAGVPDRASKAYMVFRERRTGIEDIQTYRVDCSKRT